MALPLGSTGTGRPLFKYSARYRRRDYDRSLQSNILVELGLLLGNALFVEGRNDSAVTLMPLPAIKHALQRPNPL